VSRSKTCRICGETKPLDDFYRMAGMRDGHRNECKACNLAQKKSRYDADPETHIERVTRWREANRERFNEFQRRNNARPERKRKSRDAYYRRTFGISADEFDALLEGQGGGCAICGTRPKRVASLHLDHCHETGAIRGILCLSCNQALGHFRDDPALLEAAADYLRQGVTRGVKGAGE
jgi:hypothetical protein